MKTYIKRFILSLLPDKQKIRYIAYKPRFRTWIRDRQESYPFFTTRFELYDYLNSEVIKNKTIDYLEFGVYKGDTIKYWSSINNNKMSRFIGFDTFTGLPEAWENFSYHLPRNAFNLDGVIPKIDDNRVTLVKGMFQKTLPDFISDFKIRNQLIIHNDSDIYSSTLYVLTFLDKIIKNDTIIIFDEFYFVLDEFRALEDYTNSYLKKYEVIGATYGHGQIAIRFY